MARPLPPDTYRASAQGSFGPSQYARGGAAADDEIDHLQSENAQLRQLCADLEQALQESSAGPGDASASEERLREYEALLEQKDEAIRDLHAQLQAAQAAGGGHKHEASRAGPLPGESELLQLSEDLERERRQLQEDEDSLMEQMRQMEMSMAKERAEMARQRNDLQRLHGEIRHEIERMERNGALQSKMDELKSRLQDANTRRGAAPSPSQGVVKGGSQANVPVVDPAAAAPAPAGRSSIMGRLFGGGK